MKIAFSVPVPPSINHCYFYIKGKKVKNKFARDFESVCEDLTHEAIKKAFGYKFPNNTKIRCDMVYYFKDARRRDTHNTLKLLLDSIERGGLFKDDMYVLPNVLDFSVDKANPRVELTFYEVEV